MTTDVDRIIDILRAHQGQDLCAEDVEIVPDLQIIHLYAARVGGTNEYLVHTQACSVEEVLFDGWPPERPAPGEHAPNRTKRSPRMRIDKLMSRDVHYCRPDASLESAARLMWEHDCGSLPVCSGNGEPRVVGMITDRDICMCALFQGKRLSELGVGEAMSRSITTCRAADRPDKVEELMRTQQIRRVPVTDNDGRLVGIVSLADLVREAQPRGSKPAQSITGAEVANTLAAICEPSPSRSSGAERPMA